MTTTETTNATFTVAPPARELEILAPLLGRWRSSGRTKKTIYGPGVPVNSNEEFAWLRGGYFLTQTYVTTFGEEPAQEGINYWFYDAEAKKFRIIFFSNNGAFTEAGNRYEGEVADGHLTFVGPARFQYRLDRDGRIAMNDDGSISVDWWLRDERGEFQPWMTNRFLRA